MANETFPPSGNTTVSGVTNSAKFIPEIWSDETIAEYKKNIKMEPLVKSMSMTGKKGDTIHVPKPIRGTAYRKSEAAAVTIQANEEEELVINITEHFEYSRLIEDIAATQALTSMRRAYTEDAGYQLALNVDTALSNAFTGMGGGTLELSPSDGDDWVNDNAYYFDAANGLGDYAVDTVASDDNFTDLGFREAMKILDDANVPMDNRCIVIPPAARKSIMGIERYISSDFRDQRTVASGLIGSVYGVDVYVSTNAPILETAAQSGTLQVRGCLFFHKDAVVLAKQLGVRTQTQYKQEYLADLFTADCLYGVQAYRPEAGLILAVADE